MYDPTDAVQARALLEQALAMTTQPTLSSDQVDLLMALAVSTTDTYTAAALNNAAARGWMWKAGLTSANYDIGGQGGAKLSESQWFDHCQQMAAAYGSGALSVTGEFRSGRGIGTIGLITTTSKPYWDALDVTP
jgi:hypothetical protein